MTTLTGTMLVPGVSGNGRLYTAEVISKAYQRLSERLADDDALPLTMLTHHAAGDDSKEIVGHLSSVTLNGENIDYTAELADTLPSKTIENLVKPGPDGKPSLKSVSIRGWWLGPVETKTHQGQQVTAGDDLEIDGLDFTKNPGVTGATVAIATSTGTTETDGRTLITEAVTARVMFAETVEETAVSTAPKPMFADLGYRSDKIKRFPIDTLTAAETSWERVNTATVSESYTAPQLKRIKGRIKESLKKHGAPDMTETTDPAAAEITEGAIRLSDVTECYDCWGDPVGTAGFSISAYNGPLTVSVSAYSGIDPKDLAGVATAAMKAAVDAVHALDPDDDGDLDTGTSGVETDDNMETAPNQKEAPVAETQAPAATTETKPAETDSPITKAQLDAAVETAVTAALAASKTPAAETAPTGNEATDEAVTTPVDEAALRESIRTEVTTSLIDEMRKNGTLGRKGLVEKLQEQGAPAKPVHEMNEDEFTAYRNSLLETLVPQR